MAETTDKTPDESGRLVLATGEVLTVPAEGVQASTHHYSPKLKATVPVTGAFVLTD